MDNNERYVDGSKMSKTHREKFSNPALFVIEPKYLTELLIQSPLLNILLVIRKNNANSSDTKNDTSTKT